MGKNLKSREKILGRLSEEINRAFGFSEEPGFDGPRINLGPCGPFALDFITVWNDLSKEAAHILRDYK